MAKKIPRLARVLGADSLASVAYGEIGSSIYFALGVVALYALGVTPWVILGVGALFLLVARFDRSYWKYARHQKAYASILLDAGHLSQTLYLVAADRGLGAFVTTVINNAEIDERLGLDGIDEGVVTVCGLGVSGGRSEFDPVFHPYAPR